MNKKDTLLSTKKGAEEAKLTSKILSDMLYKDENINKVRHVRETIDHSTMVKSIRKGVKGVSKAMMEDRFDNAYREDRKGKSETVLSLNIEKERVQANVSKVLHSAFLRATKKVYSNDEVQYENQYFARGEESLSVKETYKPILEIKFSDRKKLSLLKYAELVGYKYCKDSSEYQVAFFNEDSTACDQYGKQISEEHFGQYTWYQVLFTTASAIKKSKFTALLCEGGNTQKAYLTLNAATHYAATLDSISGIKNSKVQNRAIRPGQAMAQSYDLYEGLNIKGISNTPDAIDPMTIAFYVGDTGPDGTTYLTNTYFDKLLRMNGLIGENEEYNSIGDVLQARFMSMDKAKVDIIGQHMINALVDTVKNLRFIGTDETPEVVHVTYQELREDLSISEELAKKSDGEYANKLVIIHNEGADPNKVDYLTSLQSIKIVPHFGTIPTFPVLRYKTTDKGSVNTSYQSLSSIASSGNTEIVRRTFERGLEEYLDNTPVISEKGPGFLNTESVKGYYVTSLNSLLGEKIVNINKTLAYKTLNQSGDFAEKVLNRGNVKVDGFTGVMTVDPCRLAFGFTVLNDGEKLSTKMEAYQSKKLLDEFLKETGDSNLSSELAFAFVNNSGFYEMIGIGGRYPVEGPYGFSADIYISRLEYLARAKKQIGKTFTISKHAKTKNYERKFTQEDYNALEEYIMNLSENVLLMRFSPEEARLKAGADVNYDTEQVYMDFDLIAHLTSGFKRSFSLRNPLNDYGEFPEDPGGRRYHTK